MKYNYFSCVKYGEEIYFPQGNNFLKQVNPRETIRAVSLETSEEALDERVNTTLSIEEKDDMIFLNIGELRARKEDGKDNIEFYEKWLGKIDFNLTTKKGNVEDGLFEVVEQSIDTSCLPDLMYFFNKVVGTNLTVFEYFKENLGDIVYGRRFYYYPVRENKQNLILANVVRLSTTNLLEIEKLINSENFEFLKVLFNKQGAQLEKGKKLNQVINFPKFALDYMDENDLMLAAETVRNIATNHDGNTLKIIFEMFDNFKPYNRDQREKRWGVKENTKQVSFIQHIDYFLTDGYKITDILNYLLRQRMYWNRKKRFNIPYEEASILKDYLEICKKHKLKYEKYPQDLIKAHDVAAKNIKILSSHKQEAENFKKMVESYHPSDIEIGDYIFTAPKDIEDLIKEGNDLNHCIGNYTDNILKGISKIFFMRLKDRPNESLVTVELSPSNDLVEFKENYNKEPDDPEILKALNKFVKKKNK